MDLSEAGSNTLHSSIKGKWEYHSNLKILICQKWILYLCSQKNWQEKGRTELKLRYLWLNWNTVMKSKWFSLWSHVTNRECWLAFHEKSYLIQIESSVLQQSIAEAQNSIAKGELSWMFFLEWFLCLQQLVFQRQCL